MAEFDDIRTEIATIKTGLGEALTGVEAIRADITVIKDNLPPTGGLTAEQVATLRADLTDLGTKSTEVVTAITALDAENPAPPAA